MKKTIILLLLLTGTIIHLKAQDDLLGELDKDRKPEVTYTSATFKSTRLVTGHTIETIPAKHLDFIISHRFGALNQGAYSLFGLDESQIRFGLEYGITDRLSGGIGRSSYQKTFDYYLKYKLLRQSSGARKVPVSITLFASDATITTKTGESFNLTGDPIRFYNNNERQTFTIQALIARKFSERLSLQIAPTFVHRNKPENALDHQSLYALGGGGRFKISKRVSFNAEYYYTVSQYKEDGGTVYLRDPKFTNALSLGFDIETGGHVFQLHFTNSRGMIEKQLLGGTTGKWSDGDIFYGFNISRRFSFSKDARKLTK
jgi:hypothetical protein